LQVSLRAVYSDDSTGDTARVKVKSDNVRAGCMYACLVCLFRELQAAVPPPNTHAHTYTHTHIPAANQGPT